MENHPNNHIKGHGHSHGHHHHDLKGRNLVISIWLNILITISQIIGAFISGSLALLSDALHNLSDVVALIVSMVAEKLSKKKSTASKTFGYKRAEILAALINSSSLVIIAIFLIKEAFERILSGNEILIKGEWVIALAGFSIIANGLSVLLLQRHSKDSLNIKSAYLHLFSDMLSSIAVLIGGLFIMIKQIYWIDSVLTILIGFYLLYSGWGIFISSLKILMHFTPSGLDTYDIKHKLEELPEINNVHHIHIWNLNDRQIHFECHTQLLKNQFISETGELLDKMQNLLYNDYGIEHITVQFEHDCCGDKNLTNNI